MSGSIQSLYQAVRPVHLPAGGDQQNHADEQRDRHYRCRALAGQAVV